MLTLALVAAVVGCREDAESPTAPESGPAPAATATAALAFGQVSAGAYHSCGVATNQRAYCWGLNRDGQLGDGTKASRSRPVEVARGLQFIQVSAADEHTCGVTTDNLVYCWGNNDNGQLGTGTVLGRRVRPVPVAGGRRFSQVNTGSFHTCAVTPANQVYCWGDNRWGQLGDGTTTDRPTPVAVAGGLRFRRVNAGQANTCGVTAGDRAYCWGENSIGSVGDGSVGNLRLVPVAVAGGFSFRQVTVGSGHSCGVTVEHRAYCWGFNQNGPVGDGTETNRPTPVAVVGGLSVGQAVAGPARTCVVTTGNRAYCWGYNFTGALGDGTTADRLTPVAVAGGLQFSGVSPGGGHHTCGVTTLKRAYCWGHNGYGQLGNGTSTGPERCYDALPCSTKPEEVVGVS